VATWNVAVVSHGSPLVVVMAPIENKPIRGEFGHPFSRSSAWRVEGHAPSPEEQGVRGRKSTKDLRGRWVRVLGGQGSVRASRPMNRQLRADRRQTFSDQLRLTTTAPDAKRPRTGQVHRGFIFVMGAHDRQAARQRTRYETSIPPRSQGVFEDSFSLRCPAQRVDSATRPILGARWRPTEWWGFEVTRGSTT
jgi:hypothetical protein